MGEVIRKDAAAADILEDARAALRMAKEKGGDAQRFAEEKLSANLALGSDVASKLSAARDAQAPLQAAVEAEDEVCDKLLGRAADEIWNAVGRPAFDPALDLLFPGGIGYYAEGATQEQPERMDLLAELLRSKLHPRVPVDLATSLADEISAASARLRGKVEAARPASARVQLLTRMHVALGRSTQIQLAGLKRMLKASGFSEAQVHAIIPDRPPKKAAKKPVDGASV